MKLSVGKKKKGKWEWKAEVFRDRYNKRFESPEEKLEGGKHDKCFTAVCSRQ